MVIGKQGAPTPFAPRQSRRAAQQARVRVEFAADPKREES